MLQNFYYRDSVVPYEMMFMYEVYDFITESDYTIATKIRGGLNGNLRFLMTSRNAIDNCGSDFTANRLGMVMFEPKTKFKILDFYQSGRTGQILLCPDDNPIGYNHEKLLIAARQDFEALCTTHVPQVLQSSDWQKLTEYPLGIADIAAKYPLS